MISTTAATRRDEPLELQHDLSSRAIASSTPATILIVDDEIQNRKLLEALLRPEGYRTLSVANGEDALTLIAQGAPDLILLDVMMPGMDGYQVASILKANAATSNIPIIMVTAQTDRSARLAGLDAGAEDFLTKPVERAELWLRVRNLLRLKALGDFLQNHSAILEQQVQERTQSLRASESRFRQMADNIRDVFFLIDADTHRMLYVSPAYEEIWQRSRESLYANPESWTAAFHADDRASTCEKYKQGLLTGTFEIEFRIVRPDGAIRGMEMRGFPVRDDAGTIVRIACVAKDITQRKAAEDKIRRLNRVYAVLSGINTLIVRVQDRDELLREACQIAVEHGNFGLAWISTLDPATLDLTPVAWAGIDPTDQVASSKSTARADESRGRGVVGRAVRERKPVVCNDLEAEPDVGSAKRKEAIRRGYRSTVALPLIVEENVWGALTLYAREVDFFNVDELRLLTELAGDIAFALENIGRQQKLDKLSRVRAVSSEINAAIVRIPERKALLQEVCRIVSKHGKFEMIWIGSIDREKQQVQPVAWTGFTDETAHAVNWSTLTTSKGTIGDAIQSRKPAVRHDIETSGGPLREEALKRGYRSSVCLPLRINDKVTAVMVLCTTGPGFFDTDELALLEGVASDISFALQAIEKSERLNYLGYYDLLTGLANRSLFLERVASYMRSAVSGGHKLALHLIDLERFRNINDTLGRPAGDELLKQVAKWLTRTVGDANLLARVGGDYFAVVMPEVKQEGSVARLLEKQMAAFLHHPFRLNDAVFRIGAKVGVAIFPDDGADADTLFRNTEAALKKAKASGERYLFYTQQMTEMVAGRLTLENQLRQALDNGELVLHYQPKVNLASGKITSAEALIRWNNPRSGLVPPMQFIPILEETGLIYEVGRWSLRKAIADYRRWRSRGLAAVPIAVNVSPRQLRNRGFVAEIEAALGTDAPTETGLELEITESLIMEDVNHNIASLQAIGALGVTIAIDDFGTGFSSLSYLSKLPVHTLKIDRSFVIDMTTGPPGLALVSTIIRLAHSLKLKVVAEGVETEEQSRLLRLLDCDELQGYLFSKPLPGEIFEATFLAPRPRERILESNSSRGVVAAEPGMFDSEQTPPSPTAAY